MNKRVKLPPSMFGWRDLVGSRAKTVVSCEAIGALR